MIGNSIRVDKKKLDEWIEVKKIWGDVIGKNYEMKKKDMKKEIGKVYEIKEDMRKKWKDDLK